MKQWAEARLEKESEELMREPEVVDAREDGTYGKGKRGIRGPGAVWPIKPMAASRRKPKKPPQRERHLKIDCGQPWIQTRV